MKNIRKKSIVFIVIGMFFGFCFSSSVTSSQIKDNETEYWGIHFDINSYYDDYESLLKKFLIKCGGKEENIIDITQATYNAVKDSISLISEQADENDIVFLSSNSHGGPEYINLSDKRLYYSELNQWLESLHVECIIYTISACLSGSAIPIMAEEGRIIMASCHENESAHTGFFLTNLYTEGDVTGYSGCYDVPVPNGAFYRTDCDLDNNSWISILEAFNYAEKWTPIVYNFFGQNGTPELFYGYHEDINLMNTNNLVNSSDYPNRPMITGPVEAAKWKKCTYVISADDPNGKQLRFSIYFDNEYVESGLLDSGESFTISHVWKNEGDHVVRAFVSNIDFLIGGSSIHEVSVSKTKTINTPFLTFLENHPHLFPLIRQILGL